jgi:hypothetical protein
MSIEGSARECRSVAAREKATYEAFVKDMNHEIETFELEQMAKKDAANDVAPISDEAI